MKEIQGYYDGNTVQLLEPAPKTKQKVIVTFIDDDSVFDDLPVGILSKYADPAKRDMEAVITYLHSENGTEQFLFVHHQYGKLNDFYHQCDGSTNRIDFSFRVSVFLYLYIHCGLCPV